MLSVPGRGPERVDSVLTRVRAVYPEAAAAHRLDMATSGVMVMATSTEAMRALSEAFRERKIDKRYVGVVWGAPVPEHGLITYALRRDWERRPRQVVDPDTGKPCRTRYTRRAPWSVDERASVVDLEPVTGRTHQLRVHLMAHGCPLLGDQLYASPEVCAMSERLLLHATSIRFPQPLGGEAHVLAPLGFSL